MDHPRSAHLGKALPTVGSGEALAVAMSVLESASAMLVLDDGKPIGILTRSDLLGFLAHG